MTRTGYRRQLRVGMQLKSVLALAVIVIGVAATGGWLYLSTTAAWLSSNDRVQATRLLQSLALAAQHDLRNRQVKSLQQLASDFVTNDGVRFVAILDAEGRTVASAFAGCEPAQWHALLAMPVTVSETGQPDADNWLPLLKRIRDGGKLCQVYTTAEGARKIVRELGGKGFAIYVYPFQLFSKEDADDFLKVIAAEDKTRK